MHFYSVVNVHYHNGKKLSFTGYINISLRGIQCSAVIDFAICKQLIEIIHM